MSFSGDLAAGYRANLWLRSAIRVLMLLQETLLDGRRPAGDEVRRCVWGGVGGVEAGAAGPASLPAAALMSGWPPD